MTNSDSLQPPTNLKSSPPRGGQLRVSAPEKKAPADAPEASDKEQKRSGWRSCTGCPQAAAAPGQAGAASDADAAAWDGGGPGRGRYGPTA